MNYRTFDPEKKRYACAYCGLKFPMRANRASHEKEIHIDEIGKFLEISCDLCQEKLPSPVHFRRHAQDKHKKSNYTINNKESFCCDECGKTFKVKIFFIRQCLASDLGMHEFGKSMIILLYHYNKILHLLKIQYNYYIETHSINHTS